MTGVTTYTGGIPAPPRRSWLRRWVRALVWR